MRGRRKESDAVIKADARIDEREGGIVQKKGAMEEGKGEENAGSVCYGQRSARMAGHPPPPASCGDLIKHVLV